MIDHDGFKIGDNVAFRPYKEIGDEYRDAERKERVRFGFPVGMRHLCGEDFVITGFDDDYGDGENRIFLHPTPFTKEGGIAWISDEMIYLVQTDEIIPDDIEVGNLDKLFG